MKGLLARRLKHAARMRYHEREHCHQDKAIYVLADIHVLRLVKVPTPLLDQ